MFRIIGDDIYYQDWKIATLNPEVPPSVRDRAENVIESVRMTRISIDREKFEAADLELH